MNKYLAVEYFDKLTAELIMELILSQGVLNGITRVEDNVEVISDYQLV